MQCWELIVAVVGMKGNLRVICVKLKKHKALKSIELASLYVYYLWAQAIKKSALLLLSNCRGNGLQWTERAATLLFSCIHLLYSLGDQPGSNVVTPQNEHQPRTHMLIYCPIEPVRLGLLGVCSLAVFTADAF